MRDLPRQLDVEQLCELFEGDNVLVRRLAGTENPLERAHEIARGLSDAEKREVLDAHPAIGARRLSVISSETVPSAFRLRFRNHDTTSAFCALVRPT